MQAKIRAIGLHQGVCRDPTGFDGACCRKLVLYPRPILQVCAPEQTRHIGARSYFEAIMTRPSLYLFSALIYHRHIDGWMRALGILSSKPRSACSESAGSRTCALDVADNISLLSERAWVLGKRG